MGNGIKLKDFPTLTIQLPYVLFKILRNGNCISNISENENVSDMTQINLKAEEETNISGSELSVTNSLNMSTQSQCVIGPNPATDYIYFDCGISLINVGLVSASGVCLNLMSSSNGKINLSHLTTGIYYLRLIYPEGVELFKIIKLP